MKANTLVRLVKDCPQIADLKILVGMGGRILRCKLVPTTDAFYVHVKVYAPRSRVWLDLLLPNSCVSWVAYSSKDNNLGFVRVEREVPI